MPTSSAGGRFVQAIPIPGEDSRLGPLLLALASYLDSEQAGTYLRYDPVSGDPTARLADGGALSLDFEAVLADLKAQLVGSGAVDEPTFDWLCGDYLTWNSETSQIDVDPEALAQALTLAGHVGKRKFSGTRILNISFAGSDSGWTGANRRTPEDVEIASIGVAVFRGPGLTTAPVRVTVTVGILNSVSKSMDLAAGEVETFATLELPSELYGTEISITASALEPFPIGAKLAGSVTLGVRDVTHGLDLRPI